MGTKLVASKHLDDMVESAITNPQAHPTLHTIDHLLAAAATEEIKMTFLFMRIFPFRDMLSLCTPRKIKKIAKILIMLLLNNTPDEVFVDTSEYNEFFLLLPGVSKADAKKAGEQINQVFHRKACDSLTAENIHPGIQGCVITFPDDAVNRIELFRRSREALYYAEQTGEACIVHAINDETNTLTSTLPCHHIDRLNAIAKSVIRFQISRQFFELFN